MTDRYAGYIVVLDVDLREDDAQHIANAIRMIKGVVSVGPVPSDYQQYIAIQRRDRIWSSALRKIAIDGPPDGGD